MGLAGRKMVWVSTLLTLFILILTHPMREVLLLFQFCR